MNIKVSLELILEYLVYNSAVIVYFLPIIVIQLSYGCKVIRSLSGKVTITFPSGNLGISNPTAGFIVLEL